MKFFGKSEIVQAGVVPTLVIGRNQLIGIVEKVRNKILEWSLDLEKHGVLGEGLNFTKKEVQKAQGLTVNIGNFTGVLGDVTNAHVQIGDYNSIRTELKKAGIPLSERAELEDILDELPKTEGDERKGLLKKGMEWVRRNGPAIGVLSETIRKWFEPSSGGGNFY